MQAGLPHRTACRPLIIHLAPKASTDQLSLRVAPRPRVRSLPRSGPPGRATRRGGAIVPQSPHSHVAFASGPGVVRRLGVGDPPHRDRALRPYQKRRGRRAARVPRRARCAPGGVLGVLPHRTRCHPLIIHLAPKASTDQLSLRSATQNRTKAARRQSTQCQCPCNMPLCPSREHVHNMASPRSSHHCSMSNHTSMRTTRFAGATTSCDVSSQTIRTSKAENTFTSCPSGLDRPSSKLSMSSCWWPHDWLLNNLSSSGS